MKYKVKQYAEALTEIILDKEGEGPEQSRRTVESFLKFLDRNGQMQKAKEIIALAENLYIKKTGKRKVILETARKADLKNLKNILKKDDIIEEKINSELLAGIKIIINDEQLDLSMQNKINNLFQRY